MRAAGNVLAAVVSLALVAPLSAQVGWVTPTPEQLVAQACKAAGGYEAFTRLGIITILLTRDGVRASGEKIAMRSFSQVRAPGPVPGRSGVSHPGSYGDDGRQSWVIRPEGTDLRVAADPRARSMLRLTFFPYLLPFSLRWEGVGLTAVESGSFENVPVWLLRVTLPEGFFPVSAISTEWTIAFDRSTLEVVQASYAARNDASGRPLNGVRFSFRQYWQLGDVRLPRQLHFEWIGRDGKPSGHNVWEEVTISAQATSDSTERMLFSLEAQQEAIAEFAKEPGPQKAEREGPTLSDLADGLELKQPPGEAIVMVGRPPTPEEIEQLKTRIADETFSPESSAYRAFDLQVAQIASRAAPLQGMVNRYDAACAGRYTVTSGRGAEIGAAAGAGAGTRVSTDGRRAEVSAQIAGWGVVWTRATAWSQSTANETTPECRALSADIRTLASQVQQEIRSLLENLPAWVSRTQAMDVLARYGLVGY